MEKLLQKKETDREVENKVVFMTYIISKFSRAYKMSKPHAYLYLKKYGGLDFLNEFWWTLHVEDPYWSIKALYQECYENGGMR
jgi:hypothetical protein